MASRFSLGKGPSALREYDKIRVLWIDDREEMDGYPEGKITPSEYQNWFEIVHPSSMEEPLSFRSAAEFAPIVRGFWFFNDTSILPAEIIATDYNLSKRGRLAVDAKNTDEAKKSIERFRGRNQTAHSQIHESNCSTSIRGVNFEGLLISLFYGSLSYKHPAAIVPMTRYLNEMPSEVETLHALAEPFLGVDFQYIGIEDRRWANILKEGVKHLRRRIGNLFESGDITLAPSDLMALIDNANHGVLTLRSQHAMRRLPIQGLFIDVSEGERDSAICRWAKDLMRMVMVDCEELRLAQELASIVWDAYNNNELVEARKNLSLMALGKEAGKEIDQSEYERLCDAFAVANRKAKSGCVEITSTGDYTDRTRRWATLFITLNMLKKLVQIRKRVNALRINDYTDIYPTGPLLTVDDLFLALFPAPGSPLILPWHNGTNIDNSSGWVRSMMRWKHQKAVRNNRGDLALSVRDLLAGEGWKKEGPYGLTDSERLVLRGFALEDKDLSEADWRANNQSSLVLWGNHQEVGHE